MNYRFRREVMFIVAAVLIAAGTVSAIESRIKGKLPELENVFAKLMGNTFKLLSMDQLQKQNSTLSEQERSSVVNFLGKERWGKLLDGLDDQKKKFLDAEYAKLIGKGDGASFKKHLPKIIGINLNLMSVDQVKQSLANMEEKEMGTLCISMGNEGLKALFTTANRDKHAILLQATPDWVLLEMGLRKYDTIKDYTCIMLKNERIGGKMQGVEKMDVKFRVKPAAIYSKWVDGPFKGRECLYNAAVSPDKLRVRESGALGLLPVSVPLTSEIAKRGTNHLFTELGMGFLLDMILKDYKKGSVAGDLTRKDVGLAQVEGTSVYVMESILKKNPSNNYYCHRIRHYLDYTNSLEIKAEMYDWDDQLFESYTYLKIALNPGLKDSDFDHTNPNYRLK